MRERCPCLRDRRAARRSIIGAALCGSLLGLALPALSQQPATAETTERESASPTNADIEEILVIGRYIGLEVPEVQGRLHLDKTFLELMPQGSGDLTELLSLLPGVQASDASLSAEMLVEINAQPLSISAAQPWQTSFVLDGMNYNSRQDPGSWERSINAVNDIQGQPQAINLNIAMVESVDVYDNNIPVQYSGFSGGVVDAHSRSAAGNDNWAQIEWRGTRSDWGEYHIVEPFQDESDDPVDREASLVSLVPVFEKNSYTFNGGWAISERQGISVDINQVESVVTEVNLDQRVLTKRTNRNARIKYSIHDLWFDRVHLSGVYAPYENDNYRRNTLNSDMTIKGGGRGLTINTEKSFDAAYWTSSLSLLESENSREAPSRYFIWKQAKGAEWGQYSDANYQNSPTSLEGGYGDLEKTQTTYSWENDVSGHAQWLQLSHAWQAGLQLVNESLERRRPTAAYYYDSAVQYSTDIDRSPLDCNGYTVDCKALSYKRPLSELETELGEPLDFSKPEHVHAYENNVAVTPQYFQSRRVYPVEDIRVTINKLGLYGSDNIDWRQLDLYVGLRYDWDDFFRNHNLAPRLQVGWDIRGNSSMMVVAGANRYYDANLLTYKIRSLEKPYFSQYRAISNSVIQGWQLSSADSDFRTGYRDVRTPYDDELVLGWKHATGLLGTYSIKYIKRFKRDQLARSSESVREQDGYRYAYQNNDGSGESTRISVSWNKQWGRHSLWFNASRTELESTISSYDAAAEDAPTDELVWLDPPKAAGELITRAQLDYINAEFAKPITANFGWTGLWHPRFSTSLSASYTGGYDAAEARGVYVTDEVERACPECEASRLSVARYIEVSYPSRVLVNFSSHLNVPLAGSGKLKVSADVTNLFNDRTYVVKASASGVEVGRQLWLGISYEI